MGTDNIGKFEEKRRSSNTGHFTILYTVHLVSEELIVIITCTFKHQFVCSCFNFLATILEMIYL